MIGSGLVAGWNMIKSTAYKTLPYDPLFSSLAT